MQRVVITGLGCLTALGTNPGDVWSALLAGRTGIAAHALDDATLKFKALAQVAHLDTSSLSSGQMQMTERCSQMAILAARQAASDAGLPGHYPPGRIALMLGCSTNGRQAEEPETAKLYTRDARVHPLTVPRSMASNGVSQVAIDLGVTGPAMTISTACASGAHAIGTAFQMVRSGMASAALAGAHEAPLTRGFLRAWDSMRVVSPTTCRPFSADRDGMILAEGAAVLALETLAGAKARGATIYAEVLGFGASTDAHHMTQPKPEGPAAAMHAALADAATTLRETDQPGDAYTLLEQVGYINAHGTGTMANDATEARALQMVFGPRLARVPASSTKGAHGHALGASSAIEAMITAQALYAETLPFTIGTAAADPSFGMDVIVGEPRRTSGQIVALSNALAFGGLNAVLCFRSYAG